MEVVKFPAQYVVYSPPAPAAPDEPDAADAPDAPDGSTIMKYCLT